MSIYNNVNVPAGANGYFVNGYQLLDNYIVGDKASDVKVGTFACKSDNEGEIVGAKGDGAVVGFIHFQGYKMQSSGLELVAGERVSIDIGNMAIYAMDVPDGTTCKKDDYIGIVKASGELVFNKDKSAVGSGANKDTGYKVVSSNNGATPGLIHIKRV